MVTPIWYYQFGRTSFPLPDQSVGKQNQERRELGNGTRTEDITRVLRDEVLRGQYRPGERLPSERDLAARFHTTRGSARIALKKLEQLGVAAVEPGGARVQPLSEASLDAVAHLLELERPPDPALVDQVLEVIGALVAANTRMSVERGHPDALARAGRLIERLREPDLDELERHALVHDLAHAFFAANDNVVMQIVRRTLHSEIFGRLHQANGELERDSADALRRAMARKVVTSLHVESLARAVEARDGLAAYEAVHQLWGEFRATVRQVLDAARERSPDRGPSA